jgi:anti-sigma regulatory factor (Ser/Thr protein kinase)
VRLLWNQGAELTFRPEEFFGRDAERAALVRMCLEGRSGIGASVMLFGPPNIGKTSLLLKIKAELAALPEGVDLPRPFPFYFSFSKILANPLALSQHFLLEYLWQLLAFLGEPPPAGFDAEAMCESLGAFGLASCREVMTAHRKSSEKGDGLSALVNAFSYPFAAGQGHFYPVLLFDDFQYTIKLQNIPEGAILSILRPYVKSGRFPIVLSGSSPGYVTASLKREGLYGSFQMMELGGLSPEAAVKMWPVLLGKRAVRMPDGLLARASEHMGCVPIYQRMFAEEMSFRNVQPADEIAFENLFAFSVTEGKLNRYWREFFENAFPDRARRARAVKFLKRVLCDRFPIDTFEGAISLMGTSAEEGGEILAALEFKGLLKSDFEHLRFVSDPVLADFLFWAFERGVQGKTSSQVAASLVQAKIARAGREEARGEREKLVEVTKELMRRWDCREVPGLLFDFGVFRERFGGRGILEVVIGMEKEPVRIRLPKISSVSTGYKTRRGGIRFDFDLVAYGFHEADFSEESLVIWAVDVIVEASVAPQAVEHFENRCRLLALEKGLKPDQIRKWIVFDGTIGQAVLGRAAEYGISLTHRSQMRLFLNLFGVEELGEEPEARRPADEGRGGPAVPSERPAGAEPLEFELVLPMKADAEVVAARVAEEVAAYAAIDKDTVDRIKMAIIEACINAFEHSGAATGKVRLRYVLTPERIELFVQDDGEGFRAAHRDEAAKRNRGWGLKLIRELVDELDVTTGEEGTTVRMIKHFGGDRGEEAPGTSPGGESL